MPSGKKRKHTVLCDRHRLRAAKSTTAIRPTASQRIEAVTQSLARGRWLQIFAHAMSSAFGLRQRSVGLLVRGTDSAFYSRCKFVWRFKRTCRRAATIRPPRLMHHLKPRCRRFRVHANGRIVCRSYFQRYPIQLIRMRVLSAIACSSRTTACKSFNFSFDSAADSCMIFGDYFVDTTGFQFFAFSRSPAHCFRLFTTGSRCSDATGF